MTIDGPAGSGKSTLGYLLAEALGFVYFDTGIMYRALTLAALQQQIDLHDVDALEHLARNLPIRVLRPTVGDNRQYTVLLNNEDITWALRGADVDRQVSLVAGYPAVRRELVQQQRLIGAQGRVVMVGRDIGTVVMPDAPLKIYLHASLSERARRRTIDKQLLGREVSPGEVARELARRDELDARVMQPAPDALLLDTDQLTPTEEVAWVLTHWHNRVNGDIAPQSS
ncbi:MAG: (d)CMP kinase [Chloroflexaceae bacterium]|nr:(d)CMP kinase [Chloroflexaceae bacterium]